MGGGHHHHIPKVPDYKIYKVEDAPELVKIRDRLAAKGLSDPWLRNDVWRYTKNWPSTLENTRLLFFRGFGVGVVLFGLTITYEHFARPYDLHHEDGHGHGEKKH